MNKYLLSLFIYFVPFGYSQTVPNLPEPRCSGVAEVVNDTLYFFGGANRHYLGSTRFQTVYKFDGNNWMVFDSIPDNNTLGMGSAVIGTDVYLFGGYRFGNRVVRKYNVINKTWTYLNQGPNFSTFGSAFQYTNDHVYAFLAAGNVYEYDLVNDTWIAKTSNTVPGFSLSSEVYQNEVYIIGYYDSTFSHPFYKYNPVSDTWTELTNLPYQVAKCAMEVIGDKIYCVGGSNQGSPSNEFDTLLVYDILSDSWSIDQFELSSKRVWMADVTYENKFIVLGGIDTTNNAVDFVEEIVPEGVIPVELYSFNASVIGSNVKLTWITTTELNNQGFELFRNGKKIVFVDGKGTTTEKQEYYYQDIDLQPGIFHYRLEQIDFNGTRNITAEVAVHLVIPVVFILDQNYPNPFNPSTKISWQSPVGSHQSLKIYDVLGNEVATLVDEFLPTGSYEVEFNASDLASGLYLYKLQSGEFVQTRKMILMK